MQVAVLSDTHGLLREEVLKVVSEGDAVLHAGDLAGPEILEQLTRAKKPEAPLHVVRGNNDRGSWGQTLPVLLRFSLGGRRFLMVHDRKDIPENPGDAQVIVFGHSHRQLRKIPIRHGSNHGGADFGRSRTAGGESGAAAREAEAGKRNRLRAGGDYRIPDSEADEPYGPGKIRR